MKTNAKSIVYCRVSSQAQVKKGDGLGSQETRCREYTKNRGYSVEATFYDEGVSGKLLDRAKMREMLSYLKAHAKKEPIVVIIDDISRLARDLETHIKLRTAIADVGGKLESPAIEFGEDSDSRLVEHLLASVAAHQREKNAEQVKNRMRARMQNGYWVFQAPAGYRFERKSGGGKILVPDEPAASAVKTALEGFASGRFETQTDLIRFLKGQPGFPKEKSGNIHITRITEMLERVIYTGYMEYKPWGITLQPGKHEGLVSFETFNKIQERLREKAKAPTRRDIHLDFPLRGFVTCGHCGKALTACWSAGRTTRHPYYLCRNKECSENKKSIKRAVIVSQFEQVLHRLTPTPDLVYVTRTAVKQVWQDHHDNYKKYQSSIQAELQSLDKKIEQFLDRIIEADNASLIKAYETKITKMEREKESLATQLEGNSEIPTDFESSFQTVFDFIGNPQKLWHSDDIDDKRLVLKLVFTQPLAYRRNEGFQTAAISLPFKLSGQFADSKSAMVEDSGIEPLTSCVQSRRSPS